MEFHSPTFNSEHYEKHSLWYFGPYIWYRSDNKFKANLPHNPLNKTYSVLTLKILQVTIVAPVFLVVLENFEKYF